MEIQTKRAVPCKVLSREKWRKRDWMLSAQTSAILILLEHCESWMSSSRNLGWILKRQSDER